MAQAEDDGVTLDTSYFMDQPSKLVLYAGIIITTILILVLVQGKSSSIFLMLFMVLTLVLCHCYKDCRYATMFALFNLILAINAFDTVGLILIGSNILAYAEKLWGGGFTSYNIISIVVFIGYAALSYIGWLLYQEYSSMASYAADPFRSQPATFDNGNSTGIVGGGQYDNW